MELAALRTECEKLRETSLRVVNLEAALSSADGRFRVAQESAKDAEARAQAAAEAADSAIAETEDLRLKLDGITKGGGSVSALESLRQDAKSWDEERGRLTTELVGAEARIRKMKGEVESLRGDAELVSSLQLELETERKQKAEMSSEAQSIKAASEVSIMQVMDLTKQVADLEASLRTASENHEQDR